MVENASQLQERRFGRNIHEGLKSAFKWGQRVYIHYLNAINNEDFSSVPAPLRLTIEEEKIILLALELSATQDREDGWHKEKEDSEPLLPPLLDKRFELLATPDKEVPFTILPKEVSLKPPIFSLNPPSLERLLKGSLFSSMQNDYPNFLTRKAHWIRNEDPGVLDKFPNRITPRAVENHFEALYELARQCKPGVSNVFDFTLLALLKRDFDSWEHDTYFASILFYVRHFSNRFQHLSFATTSPTMDKTIVFSKICKTLEELATTSHYADFQKDFLGAKAVYNYSKEVTLTAIKQAPREPFSEEIQHTHPQTLQHLCQRFFDKEEKPLELENNAPFLDSLLIQDIGPLEKQILARILEGYEELKLKTVVSYHFRDKQLASKQLVLDERQNLHDRLTKQKKSIERNLHPPYTLVNGKVSRQEVYNELTYLRGKDCQQVELLTPEKIMKEVILRGDLSYLSQKAPLLSEQEMLDVIHEIKDYYHNLVLYENLKEACDLLQKLEANPDDADSAQSLAEILDYPFDYDPQEHPEISYLKMASGKLPRPEQISIYKWIYEGLLKGENRMFQLAAGGGKSSYLIPLLMLLAKRLNLTPVVLTTQTIYNIDKKILAKP